jgi:hypothetical protein
MECFFSSIRFWHRNAEKYILAVVLILSASLAIDICPLSGGTLPQPITILYSNNINAEIDPCPT